MTTVPDLLHQIGSQLPDIADNIRWAHAISYDGKSLNEPRRWIDRDTPARTPSHNGDHQPGPTYDLGVGDHLARTSLERTDGHLIKADAYLLVAVGPGVQPPVREPSNLLPCLLLRIRAIRWRTDRLQELEAPYGPVVRLSVGKAAHLVDMAWKDSGRPFQRGPATVGGDIEVTAKRCRICRTQPAAPKCGGRCYRCRSWFVRHGYERPRKLDEQRLAVARDAKDRRAARGEGYGVS